MKKMLKDTFILLLITLISGLALGFVYEITKEPIAKQKAKARIEAFKDVFSDATEFPAMDGFTEISDENGNKISEVVKAQSETGELLGYVFAVTTSNGYAGNISFSMGIRLDGTLNGISITEIGETPGLGMNAEDVLVPQFENKTVQSFTVVKTGSISEDQIDAISSATITSTAITEAVNYGLTYYATLVGGGVNE